MARVVPDVAIEPAYLRFDGASMATPRVRLTSRSGADFEVVRIDAPPELLHIARVEAEEGDADAICFKIEQAVAAPALSVCEVVFHLRSASARVGEITAPLQVVMRP